MKKQLSVSKKGFLPQHRNYNITEFVLHLLLPQTFHHALEVKTKQWPVHVAVMW
jgi:hypothetical protein